MVNSSPVLLPTAEPAGLSTVKVPTKCSLIDLGNLHQSHIHLFDLSIFNDKKTEGSCPPFWGKEVSIYKLSETQFQLNILYPQARGSWTTL